MYSTGFLYFYTIGNYPDCHEFAKRKQANLAIELCSIFYQCENIIPASGDNTIMIIENVNDSMEINVARCSDGKLS